MNVIDEIKSSIIIYLIEENYLNEERFAKSYARGKFRLKKWGKQRIVRELKFRQISNYNINSALNEIEESEYIKTFNELATKRWLAINESNLHKKRKKLVNYLLYRGWESDLIYKKTRELMP
jgi:regulatory protein